MRKILTLSNDVRLAWYLEDGAQSRANWGNDHFGFKWKLGKRRQAIFADMLTKGETSREVKTQGVFSFEK